MQLHLLDHTPHQTMFTVRAASSCSLQNNQRHVAPREEGVLRFQIEGSSPHFYTRAPAPLAVQITADQITKAAKNVTAVKSHCDDQV
jgi:hypothetical protein